MAATHGVDGGGGYPSPIRPGFTRIAWIGTGLMGAAMAIRILAAGYPLTVYARTPSKALHLQRGGAALAASPSAAAASTDVIFTMVSHPSDVRTAALLGALPSLSPGAVLVDMTSSSPSLACEIAAAARSRGCFAVDAPVSGGDVGARDGKLAIMAGGEEAVVEWLKPLFDLMGQVTFMGGAGYGQSSKIANQIVVGGNILGLTQAMAPFARAAKLDEREFLEVVSGRAASSAVMENFGEKVIKRDFHPGGFSECLLKDLGMGLDGNRVALPGAALCQQLYVGMVANGDGKIGFHGLITAIERISGKNHNHH